MSVCAQNHFQSAPSSHETRQLRHGATTRHKTGATSNCDKMAFFRLAKRMSQAGQAHFPYPSPARESTR